MSSQLVLAAQIAKFNREELETLIRSRVQSNPAQIDDPLDLAGVLLKPESIRRALCSCHRDLLRVLAGHDAQSHSQEAVLTGLAVWAEPDAPKKDALVLLPEVSEVLSMLLNEHQLTTAQLADHPTPETGVDAQPEPNHRGMSNELAFETVRITSQMLRALRDESGATRVGTTPNAATTKRLAAEVALEPESVAPYVRLLEEARILQFFGQRFWPSVRAQEWQAWSRPRRYAELITAWLDHSKPFIRAVFEGCRAQGFTNASAILAERFPLAPEQYEEELAQFLSDAKRFGVIVADRFSPVGAHLFAGEVGAAIAELEQAFPSSVTQVYLQPDLSIIAPGPLEPTFEDQLLEFAALESAGLASSYRISARTLETALSSGHTEDEIRAFLTAHSLTGIPQPVDYLLNEAHRRHGSIVVLDTQSEAHTAEPSAAIRAAAAVRANTLVQCAEPALLSQLLVDRALVSLSFTKLTDTEAWTLFSPQQVVHTLREAGYPVTREHTATEVDPVTSDPVDNASNTSGGASTDPIVECANRVYEAGQEDQAGGSLERVLQLAVRQKQRLRVVMQQADGTEREFVLRSVGLSNGRFRGIDEQAEVERTLPVNQLSTVEQLTG